MDAVFKRLIVALTILLTMILTGCDRKVTTVAPLSASEQSHLNLLYYSSQPLGRDQITRIQNDDSPLQTCEAFQKSLPKNFKQAYAGQVFYYTNANGDVPTLVLNGGGTDSHALFQILKNELSTKPVLFIDPRGTGCSGDSRAWSDSQTTTIDTLAVMDALKINRVNIFAHSSGGQVALRLLETSPSRIASIRTLGTSLVLDPETWVMERRKAQRLRSHEFFKRYTDVLKITRELFSKIKPSDCFTNGTSTVCGPAVLHAAYLLLSEQKDWPALADWLITINGGGTIDRDALKDFIRYFVFTNLQSDRAQALYLFHREYGGNFQTLCKRSSNNGNDTSFDECTLVSQMAFQNPIELGQTIPIRLDIIPKSALSMFNGDKDIMSPLNALITDGLKTGIKVNTIPGASHSDEGFMKKLSSF